MPSLDVDTSSYLKPQPVAPTNPLDTMGKVIDIQRGQQALQSGGLSIDKQKLDLINQRYEDMSRGLAGIATDPNFNEDKLRRFFTNQVKAQRMTPEMAGNTISSLPPTQGMKPAEAAATLKQWVKEQLVHASAIHEAINHYAGQNDTQNDNANTYVGVRQSPLQGGRFDPTNVLPTQVPPTQPTVNNQLQMGVVGPSAPSGVYPAQSQNSLPVASASPPVPMPQRRPPSLPVAPPATTGPTGPTIDRGTTFNDRFNGGGSGFIPTSAPPGVADAKEIVGKQSGTDYATALSNAGNLGAALQPDLAVLDIVKGKGPGDFGPGTDKLNQLKKLAVTWLPNVDPKLINDSSDFDTVKKYLIQGARSNGNTSSNDQLAAAFEGSPNVTMNTATIESIVKSRVALKKMEAAEALMFQNTGLPESDFSKWKSKNQNQFDPRAFGFDMMDREKQDKLLSGFTEKENDSKEMKAAKAKAYTKFRNTLQFAHDAQLIGNE
jgi:hypothetical protein